ncbi:MAG: YIP1 family protein [Chthoniobacterales bacterium]
MANIFIARGETKLGDFSEDEIRDGLPTGRFTLTDLGWREGMANWLPLSQFPEFSHATAAGSIPAEPVPGSIPPAGVFVPQPLTVTAGGLPWDRRQELGLFKAFFETLKVVLLSPGSAFTAMKPEGGMVEPLIFALIGCTVGCAVYLLFSLLLSSLGIMADRNALAGVLGMGIGAVFAFIFIPVFVAFGLFLGAGIVHLCLMLVGGAKRSFETTFRVVCYSAGSTYPLLIVPICGGVVAAVWCLVVECIGLGRAHGTTTGRAVLAVLLPMILCCGGGLILATMFGVMGALFGQH